MLFGALRKARGEVVLRWEEIVARDAEKINRLR